MSNTSRILQYVALGTPLVIGCFFALYRLFANDPPQVPSKVKVPAINQNKLHPIVRELNRQLTDVPLSQQPQLMKKIYQRSVQLVSREYVDLVLRQRASRRKLSRDRGAYVREILKGEEQKKQLKDDALHCILAQMNISEDSWSQAVVDWTRRSDDNDEQWHDLIGEMQQSLLEEFELKKSKMPELSNVLNTHLKFIKDIKRHKGEFKEVEPQHIPIVVNQMVNDQLFYKYQAEKQDISAAVSQLQDGKRDLLQKYFEQISEVFQSLIVEDSLDLEKTGSG